MKRLARAGLGLSLALTLLGLAWWRAMPTANAVTNNTINFQARLQTAAGSIVQDGYYNVEFKLYSAASGGTAEWTEDYTYNSGSGSCSGPLGGNDCRIRVVDGYLTANLGSISSFPSTINWDQQQWLTMNIGGTVTSGSFPAIGDGEMNPRIQLTGVPYAFKAGSAFNIQNTSGTNLLSTSGNQVTLQNATSSSAALTFGGDNSADLYRSVAGTIRTDGALDAAVALQTNDVTRIDSSGNLTNIGNITLANPGIGNPSTITFTKTSDHAWISVEEVSNDATTYGFYMSDNPDSSADQFLWQINDWKGPGGSWQPLQFSNISANIRGADINAYGDLNVHGPWYSGIDGTPNTVYTSQTGTLNLTPGVSGYTGTYGFYWVKIDGSGSPNTFSWGYNTSGSTGAASGTNIPITGSAQTLNSGVTITFSGTTGGVIGDLYEFRVYKGGDITADGNLDVNGDSINLGSASTAANSVITVQSQGNAGLVLQGDTDNDPSEVGSAYVQFGQDATANVAVIGTVQNAGASPQGGTYTGTSVNAVLLGSVGAEPLQFGTSGTVRMTVSTSGQVGIGATPANGLLTIGTNTTTATGGLYFGTDTNLYRGAANTLQTDDKVVLNGGSQSLQIGTTGCNNLYIGNTTDGIIRCNNQFQFVTTQTQGFNFSGGNLGIGITNPQAALALGSDAGTATSGIKFGSTGDTNLYRSAAGVLKTDNNLTVVGNITATSTIRFSNTGNANQGINLNMVVSNAVSANQVVVIDTSNQGEVVKPSAGGATGVFGVTTQAQSAGVAQPIVVSGIYQVTADTGAVNVGDYLVTSSTTAGDVMSSTDPAAGTVLGQAMSSKASGSAGLVWVYINPGGGGGGSTSTTVNYNSYGLMESDFINTGAHLPGTLEISQLATIGNTMYLFGGEYNGVVTNKIFSAPVSDPTNWTDTGGTLPAAADLSQVAVIGSYVYLFGSNNGSGAATNIIYRAPVSDPVNGWQDMTTVANGSHTLPGTIRSSQLAIIGNYVYLFGGFNGTSGSNVIYRASTSDPLTWSNTGGTLPGNLNDSSIAVIGNYVYLFGGMYNNNFNTANQIIRAPISDPVNGWANVGGPTVLPTNLLNSSLAIIGNYIYLFGGDGTSTSTNAIFRAPINNPYTGWVNTGNTINSTLAGASVAVVGNAVYLFGGLTGHAGSSPVDTIFSAPIYNGSPDVSSNPSWKVDSNYSLGGGGSGTSSQTANNNYELAYNQAISSFTVGSTNSAAPDTVLTASSITSDGNTPVMVQFDAPQVGVAGSTVLDIALYRDSTVVGVQQIVNNNNPGNEDYPVDYQWRDLPSAGSHTYSIRAYKSNANGVTIYANAGGFNTYAPMFIRITLANPQLQGGAGIQNGTTLQTGNFNLQSSSQNNPTGILRGATSQSADIFEVQDAGGANLLSVGPTGNVYVSGNLTVGGTIGFAGSGNSNQGITVNEVVTSAVNAGDVVVIDTANAGQVTDSTTANSTKVFGIATQTHSAGVAQPIVISGIYQVNVTGTVAVGDYLVTSSTPGQAQSSSSPTGGVVGQAMGPAVSGKAWARIAPASGAGGGSSGGGLTKLYDVTLGSNTASFDVPNIPAGYDSLEGVLVANNDTTSQGNALIRLNNISTGYFWQSSYGTGATPTATNVSDGTATSGLLGILPRSAGNSASIKFTIPNYTGTSLNGTHIDSQFSAMNNNSVGSLYSGTATSIVGPVAVNRITILPSSGNFIAGSRFILYGVGGSGAVSGGSGGSGTTELSYNEFKSTVSITASSESTSQTVVNSNSVYTDGNTPINVNFYAPVVQDATGQTLYFNLFDGATNLGEIGYVTDSDNANYVGVPVNLSRELAGTSVPSAGWHTYYIKAWNGNAGQTQSVMAGTGGSGQKVPGYIRITLANPSLQGGTGSGIQNGTTLQTNANFNIQSASASSVTAIIHGTTSQSADVLDVQNSSNINLMSVDPNGNVFVAGDLNVGGTIGFSGTGNENQGITLNMVVTSGVNAGDVVVIDASNPGQVTTTTLANSTKVFGVATQTQTAGVSQPIITSGIYQVNVDTAAVNIGDYLVTSGIAGLATDSTSPSGGVIGQALSAKAAGSNGTVWARINPGNGAGGSGSSANYGLMESDFIDTGANIPEPTGLAGASVATIGNYIYMFGGTLSSGNTNNIYRAPVSNPTSWSVVGTLPHKLSGSSLAIVGSYVYLFGGYDGTSSAYVSTIWRAPTSDPVGSWSSVSNLPGADAYASLAIVNNTIYIYGGYGGSMKNTIYTASTGDPLTWSTSGNVLPQSFDNSQAAIIGNYVYLFGGDNGSTAFSNIYRAKVSSPTVFTSVGNLPNLLRGGMVSIIGNYVYIFGGNNQSVYMQSIWRAPLSNPVSGWSALTPTIPSPINGGMVYIAGNALYIAGGFQSGSPSVRNSIFSAPIYNGSPDVSSNPSWITDSNYSSGGGGSGTSSQTANTNTELAYNEFISPVTVSATSASTANLVVTATPITSDGSTPVIIEFFAPRVDTGADGHTVLSLYEDGSSIGDIFGQVYSGSNMQGYDPVHVTRRLVPSAGSHTFSIRAWRINANGTVEAGPGGTGGTTFVPGYVRITLANPQLQGGSDIQNGTTVQTGNFNIQSSAANNVTAVIQGATSQSADILEVKDASNTNLLAVDASGNLSVKGNIGFSNSGNANQVLTVNEPVTTTVNQYDVVVIDTNNAGQVTTTTLANSTKVFGVATKTSGTAGVSQPIAISGIYQVNVDTAAVNVGDYLVTSGTAGLATDSQYPSGGVIGQALSAKASGSNGTVWARINPGNGAGGSGSGASYGLMESDFTDTGATLPGALRGASTVTVNNTIYLFGGSNTNIIYSAPVSNPTNWTNTGKTLPGIMGYSSVAVIGSKIYLFGGLVNSSGTATNAIYSANVSDPTTWTNTGKTLPGNLGSSSLAIIGNYVYLFGGSPANNTYSSVIYSAPVSDPTTWSNTGKTLPTNLIYSSIAVIGNYVYLFGGYNGTSPIASIYRTSISDPTVGWSNVGSLPTALAGSHLAIIGGYVYLFGGSNSGYINVIYRAPINNAAKGWVNTNSTLPISALAYTSLAIAGNAVYLFGGFNGSVDLANIYSAPIYDGSPDLSSNPSWITDTNVGSGGGSGTSSQTANNNYELGYGQVTTPVSITATSAATANTIATATSITTDGNTPVMINTHSYTDMPSGGTIWFELYDGSTDLGVLGAVRYSSANEYSGPQDYSSRITPSAGSHTYSIKAYVSGSGITVYGNGSYEPAYIRITLANPQLQGGSGINNSTTLQTGNINLQSASANNPTLVVQGATSQSADILDVKDGSGNIVFNVGPTGNVGINNSSPQAALDVGGNIYAGTTAAGGGIYFRRSDGQVSARLTSDASNTELLLASNGGGSHIKIQGSTAGGGYVAINPDGGNVGIGTSTVGEALSVNAGAWSSNANGGIQIGAYTSNVTLQRSAAFNLLSNGTGSYRAGILAGSTEAISINIDGTAGYVGINNTNPQYRLDVNGTGNFSSYLDADYLFVGHGSVSGNAGNSITFNNINGTQYPGNISGGGTLFVDAGTLKYRGAGNISTISSDYSEDVPVENGVEPGDVVSITDQTSNDKLAPYKFGKASVAYDNKVVGVISSLAGNYHDPGYQALTFIGRVPVKISDEGGPIAPGDYLTSASTPGYAMKAAHGGMVIGRALGYFGGSDTTNPATGTTVVGDKTYKTGSVVVSANTSYYSPGIALQGSDADVASLTATSLTVNGDASVAGDISVGGHIIGNDDTNGTITVGAGQVLSAHTFNKAYSATPNVVVTPTEDTGNLRWWVTKDNTSFTVHLSGAPTDPLNFDYIIQQGSQ